MKSSFTILACLLFGVLAGCGAGAVLYSTNTNPVVIYFVVPLVASLATLAVNAGGPHRILRLLATAAGSSLALFLTIPDRGTPALGKLEYWLVMGVPVFTLFPAFLAEGLARLMASGTRAR